MASARSNVTCSSAENFFSATTNMGGFRSLTTKDADGRRKGIANHAADDAGTGCDLEYTVLGRLTLHDRARSAP